MPLALGNAPAAGLEFFQQVSKPSLIELGGGAGERHELEAGDAPIWRGRWLGGVEPQRSKLKTLEDVKACVVAKIVPQGDEGFLMPLRLDFISEHGGVELLTLGNDCCS